MKSSEKLKNSAKALYEELPPKSKPPYFATHTVIPLISLIQNRKAASIIKLLTMLDNDQARDNNGLLTSLVSFIHTTVHPLSLLAIAFNEHDDGRHGTRFIQRTSSTNHTSRVFSTLSLFLRHCHYGKFCCQREVGSLSAFNAKKS